MALFQTEQAQINNEDNNKPDAFTRLGFDEILEKRYNDRQKRIEEENLFFQNMISPEKIQEWKNQGSMTAIDVWNKKNKNELMPFMGTWSEGSQKLKLKGISDRIRNGQYVTPEEHKMFEGFIMDMAEIQTRGYTLGGHAMNIGLETIPFMAEFGIGLLTTGGTSSFGATASKISTKVFSKSLAKQIAKGAMKTAINVVHPKTLAFSATRLPQQVRLRMGDLMLSESVAITPEGQAILTEAKDKPYTAFMKALALTNIEVASEMSGEILVRPMLQGGAKLGRVISGPVLKNLPKGFADDFVKLAEKVTKIPFTRAVDKLGWNGILEEMGEERIGDLMKFALNLDGEEGYSFEQLLDAVFPNISQGLGEFGKSLAAEALSFGVTGMGINAVDRGLRTIPKVGDKYTKDGFLLDAGIFRMSGYDSYLDSKVREELKGLGKTEEEIDDALDYTSRDDKVQFLKDVKAKFDTKNVYDEKQELARAEVEEKTYDKFTQGGKVENNQAFSLAKLLGVFYKNIVRTKEAKEKFDKWFDKFEVRYNVPVNEQGALYQDISIAGANENEIEDAKREYKEKGTDSKYFKKWSGDTPVVKADNANSYEFKTGKGVTVEGFHGTTNYETKKTWNSEHGWYDTEYKEFEVFKNTIPNQVGHFFVNNEDNAGGYGDRVYHTYISMKNPLVIDCNNQDYSEITFDGKTFDTYGWAKFAKRSGYDGVIFTNIIDGVDYGDLETANTEYVPFNSTQIKSVDNRGTFDANNPNIYYQTNFNNKISSKTIQKAREVLQALQKIANGSEEETVKNLRDDLEQYGGTNDVTFIFGNDRKGIKHIAEKHGKKTLLNVFDTVIDGNIKRYVPAKKTVILGKGNYEAVLSLDEHGKQKTWLLSGWDITKKSSDEIGEVSTQSDTTQIKPTFSRQDLGAELSNIITDNSENLNPGVNNHEGKTYKQEGEDEKLIAGYTYMEIGEKLTSLWDEMNDDLTKEQEEELLSKIHVLEDAINASENRERFGDNERYAEAMLNAYYVMNDEELPKDYVEKDRVSTRTMSDYKKLHDEKKEKAEQKYYGYFTEGTDKNIITIMSNSNASTALHELGHLFYNGLVELSNASDEARKQLDAVNKHFGIIGEMTDKQAERFARSFEAYLYKGKAPNNTLRSVFENFKEWLRSVYQDVSDLVNKGADISDEVQELFDRMFADDSYYQERKAANELLEKVKKISTREKLGKIPAREDKGLDETAKRHKEAAYQILSTATGKSIKYLKSIFETDSTSNSILKKREAIESLLDKVGDRITVETGMLDEWKEFFNDTGVSYNYGEVDGDYKLAMQAYETIIHKSYGLNRLYSELEERAEFFEKAVDEADRQYKTLLREYVKGNKNIALSAMYEWLEDLPKEIREDYEEKFNYDLSEIERNENRDKFEKAKRDIIAHALEIKDKGVINKNEEYQETVKTIMKNLDFLQPQDKAKLTANILDVPSASFLMSRLNDILDIAKTMEDVNLRRKLESDIHKELQGTKNVKKNGRSVGKYDYRTNIFFEKLRQLDRLSQEQAQDLITEFYDKRFENAEKNGITFLEKLENEFLKYKAGGRTFTNTELLKEIYDNIVKIKLIGKSAKSELELQEKINNEDEIDNLIDIVQKKKEANAITKAYNAAWSNLESCINLIFNKDIKEKYASEILYSSTESTAFAWDKKDKLINKIAEIYELPKWNWDKRILEYLNQKFTYSELRRRKYDADGEEIKSRPIDRTMTKMDIIDAYIQSKNEVGFERLKNQFSEETLYEMFDELSLQDVKLAEALMETVQELYPLVNKVYQRKYGLDLPRVSNYFPFTPERGTEVENYNEYMAQSYSFTKSRAKSELIPMDFHNPIEIAFSHIDNAAKFIYMSEQLDHVNKLFLNTDLKRAIINKYGEGGYKTLEQLLVNVTCRKQQDVYNGINEVVNTISNNWLGANVAVKPITGIKQLLSASNYGVDMPSWEWRKGFLNAVINFKDTIDYMMKIPYLKARFHGGFSSEALKQTIENSAFAKTKSLKNFLALNIKLGDIGAIIFGGKPYIDYLMNEKGMTEQEAIKQFVLSTNRSQQSGEMASLSNFQVATSRNPFMRIITAYRNAQQQYVRMCGDAIVSLANGDITKAQCAKVIFQYAFLQPFIFALMGSGSLLTLLLTGDDDDLLNDLKMSVLNLGSDSLAVFGDMYKYAIQRFLSDDKYTRQGVEIPMFSDMIREINKISKEDTSFKDYMSFASFLGGKTLLGVDTTNVVGNMAYGGITDILDGDIIQGLLRLYGMTEKRAKRITGNEDKKKKRSK